MKIMIMANGQYGDINFYRRKFSGNDCIICADGGANYAYQLGWRPAVVMGDMDSILAQVRSHFAGLGVPFQLLPCRKDPTDTQAVLALAEEMGASQIIMLGTLGGRIDHTLSNLYSGIRLLQQGISICHVSPQVRIDLVNREFEVKGRKGDLVSILALTDEARGVTIQGFEYPLQDVCLLKSNPYAVSNVMTGSRGTVYVQEGILAVFHYWQS